MKNTNAVTTLAAVVLVSSASVFASGTDNQCAVGRGLACLAKPALNHPLLAGLAAGGLLTYFGPKVVDSGLNQLPWKTEARKQALAAAAQAKNRKTAHAALMDGPKKNNDYVALAAAADQAETARLNKLKELVGNDATLVVAPAPVQAQATQPTV